jgi:hypothetical protein
MLTRKQGWSSLMFAVLFLGVTTVATLPLAAQDRDHLSNWAKECSLRTLHGRYGIFAQGTLLATSAHPAYPFVVSGIFTYDGEGNVSGTYNQSVGGGISTALTAEGTYQVNPDCTYSAELTTPAGVVHRVGTITGEGMLQEIHILYTDSSSVAFGTLKKIRERPCSLATLKGAYALFGQGTILPPAPASPLADATAGILTFDGEGNFSGEDTANINGTSAPVTFTGTYAVTPDCGVSAVIYASNGHTLQEEGSITGEGEFKEIHDIFTTAGWVFTDTLKKQR